MNTLTLILLRHGQTSHNTGLRLTGWGDPPLDETGQEQARQVAAELTARYKIGAVYSSPLLRTRQTAAPLLQTLGLQAHISEDLKELYFGEVEGMTMPEVREKHPHLFTSPPRFDEPDFGWPGGETRMVFHSRVDRAIWEIITAEAGREDAVAIVSHGGSVGGFISELETGQPYQWRQFLLQNCQYYVVEVHYSELPLTRTNCTLRVAYAGKVSPLRPGE